MRALALMSFFVVLEVIGQIRGRAVSYIEQVTIIGNVFLFAIVLKILGII